MSASGKELSHAARIAWLDGLRGIAALQVVVLHYVTAFLPAIGLMRLEIAPEGWERWFIHTPLFFPSDGYYAVYVFFLLSGVALTLSFRAHPRAVVQGVLRRVVRLGLPVLAAVAMGVTLLLAWPKAHSHAAALTGSQDWLGVVSPHRISMALVLHQLALESMFAGYREVSLLPGGLVASLHLTSLSQSVNAPLWTMHIEFAGSLLVLFLVFLRTVAGRLIHALACIAVPVLLGPSPLVLFLAGHVGATMLARGRAYGWVAAACGVVMLCLGVGLDTHAAWPCAAMLQGSWLGPPAEQTEALLRLQLMCCAVLVFGGAALLPGVHAFLRSQPAQWLGRISFGLYLVHFPILFTVVSALFVWLSRLLPFEAAAAGAILVGAAVTVPAAIGFSRWVDAPAVWLSRRVGSSPDTTRLRSADPGVTGEAGL